MSSADTLSTISFKLRQNSPWVIQRELVQQWNWWQQRCCSSAPSPWVIQLCSTNSTWRIATGSQFQGTDFQFQRRGGGRNWWCSFMGDSNSNWNSSHLRILFPGYNQTLEWNWAGPIPFPNPVKRGLTGKKKKKKIAEKIFSFYLYLYKKDGIEMHGCVIWWEKVSWNFRGQTWQEISMGEVSKPVFPLCGDKAPGSDGFSIVFYMNVGISIMKSCWLDEGLWWVYENGKVNSGMNFTFITLIPKRMDVWFISLGLVWHRFCFILFCLIYVLP